MTAIKVQFDGRVLIPEEPISLPTNKVLEIYLEPPPLEEPPLRRLAQILRGMPDNPDTPSDLAAQHDHYLHGMPKRS